MSPPPPPPGHCHATTALKIQQLPSFFFCLEPLASPASCLLREEFGFSGGYRHHACLLLPGKPQEENCQPPPLIECWVHACHACLPGHASWGLLLSSFSLGHWQRLQVQLRSASQPTQEGMGQGHATLSSLEGLETPPFWCSGGNAAAWRGWLPEQEACFSLDNAARLPPGPGHAISSLPSSASSFSG